MKKRVFAVILGSVMAVSLMACGTKDEGAKDGTKTYTVGISQFAEHGSLDNCRKGFLKGLESEGIKEGENLKITYKNSQADTATDNQIASNFASKKLDMICAIATQVHRVHTMQQKTVISQLFIQLLHHLKLQDL